MEYLIVIIIIGLLSYVFCSSAQSTFLIAFIIISVALAGYTNNIIQITKYDFKEPLKAEALRSAGIIVPPVGCILGYIDIKDE